ncbi:hypothetical protein SAMN04488020_10927 [Palleronia marisminoris]|uniref:hypothetical protein n=1 Tax=Palleronia marisminoris TaxID=315423 RepID=UPI0008F41129|nr:hypothetical protein [Palleronia marisminoris]SFH26918.1 hypothetical protein SAMN04488020_10927 [Palleronia marisminoris]
MLIITAINGEVLDRGRGDVVASLMDAAQSSISPPSANADLRCLSHIGAPDSYARVRSASHATAVDPTH